MAVNFYNNPSFSDVPYGLKLRQTITSSGAVTIPSNIKRVFAICIGGGGAGGVGTQYYAPATITNVVASGGTITYTCNNTFVADDSVRISGVNPSSFNLTNVRIVTASATQFTVTNAATGTYVSGGTANAGSGAGGGGAGAFAMGWTFPDNTCTVAAGGAGISSLSTAAPRGGITRFGGVIAGGGGGGRSNGWLQPIAGIQGGAGGGGAYAGTGTVTAGAGSSSFFGWNFVNVTGRTLNFAPNGEQSGAADGVVASGGAGTLSSGGSYTGTAGGRGIIGGGGGAAASASGTATGGAGGNGDFYNGGTGSAGTAPTGGAGGGGGGYAGAGGNASGTTGGNGGDGGGGGGAATNIGTSGSGGNGVIYLYY